MKIFDISQEVFGCDVYPGDPRPQRERVTSMADGAAYNLTAFSMCAHNGTHVDAPYHFFADGQTVDGIDLDRFIGYAYVAAHEGDVTGADAAAILQAAREVDPRSAERILIRGKATVTVEAARAFAAAGIKLLGNESQSVGPEDAPMAVHRILLGAQTVLLEGIRLRDVAPGVYLLHAAPLNLAGADGSPCRATLLKL